MPELDPSGYWNAPCGAEIYSGDGTASPLIAHIRDCNICKQVLTGRAKGPFVQHGDRVRIAQDVAEELGL